MNMRQLSVGECFYQIRNGANIKQGDISGGYPITRIETTANDTFNRDRMGYAGITDLTKYESYILDDGDLLMSHINSVQYLGRTVLYRKQNDETIIHGMNLLVLKARREIMLPEYARYCFYSHSFREQLSRITKKSVNQASFTVADLKKITILVPSLAEQLSIVAVLDKCVGILDMRKAELSTLDDLIKTRFVEMFGEPFDTSRWEMKELKDLSESMVDGSNVDPTYYEPEGKVLFLRIQNVWRNEFRLADSVYITPEINRTLYYDTSLKKGDLLITKIGRYYTKDSSLGRVSVYLGENDCANYSNNIMRVRLKDSVDSEFVNALLNLDEYQSFIKRTSKGGTDKRALSKSLIGSYPIIVPPTRLQKEFIGFIKQVDKSKDAIKKSLAETQTLFDSLMQTYFG